MANTYVQIGSTVTVGSGGQAAIDFTSIPSTYTDLLVKVSARSTFTGGSNSNMKLTFNGSSSGYSGRGLQGAGSGTPSSSDNVFGTSFAYISSAYPSSTTTSNTFNNMDIYIPNYAGSAAKSFSTDSVMENNATYSVQHLFASLWNNTAAITSISLGDTNGNFAQYSTATLYGISKS